jgi:hypothetical protein
MPPAHAIRRQIIEITVADQASARRVTSLVSAAMENRVMPVLERVFDAASAVGETIRIDRLELDLGRLDPDTVPEQLVERLISALRAALRRAAAPGMTIGRVGRAAERPEPAAACLVLISQFARTGGLPWSSDTRERRALDGAVSVALNEAPAALARMLRGLAAGDIALDRLIGHLTDDSLRALLRAVLPAAEVLSRTLLPLTGSTPAFAAFAPARARLLTWRGLLRAALDGDRTALTEAALIEIAAGTGTTLSLLAADLRMLTDGADERLGRDISEIAARHPVEASAPVGLTTLDLATLFERLANRADLARLLARLRPLIARLTVTERLVVLDAPSADRAVDSGPALIGALLRPFMHAGLIQPAELVNELAPLARAEADSAARDRKPDPRPARQVAAEDEDSRLVATAGLCLLWPFLPRFLARLGLLDAAETGFADPPAAHRAVLLLHHLATGEAEAPEYALLLEKVLCGLEPHAMHYPSGAVDKWEMDEASQLLDAAIAHATCFGEITGDGLRGSFLARPGIVSTRDGAWLLRVERRTEDILLDRLPWTMQWVRLPWMQAPMWVEW